MAPLFLCQIDGQPLIEENLFVKGILKKNSKIFNDLGHAINSQMLHAYDIFYVYDDSDPNYYQIGPDLQGPIGYVPKGNMQRWNTRICVRFTSLNGRDPALIFKSAEDLADCLRGADYFYTTDKKPNTKTVAQEPDDTSAYRSSIWLPVINYKKKKTGSKYHNIFKVGFLDGNQADVPVSRSKVISSSKEAELELMFLIDATNSMIPFINSIKNIIENVTKKISKHQRIGIRFGITAYRDYIDNQAEMEYITKQYINLTANSSAVIKTLDEIDEAGVDSEDFPEAVFDGFYTAMTETNWLESFNTSRIIVLIGAASGHPPGSPKNPMNYSLDLLLKKASEERIRTIAVQILTGREDDKLSKKQFEILAQGLTTADKGKYIVVGDSDSSFTDDYAKKITAQIEVEIMRMEQLIDIMKEAEKNGAVTFPSASSASDSTIILKSPPSTFRHSKPFRFSTGWISEKDLEGRRLLTPHIYMTKDEFDLMITYIKLAKNILSDSDEALVATVKETIKAATGETLKGKNLDVYYEKIIGLPVKTDVLKIPIDELATWGSERKERLLRLIEEKYNQLEVWGNNPENWHYAPGNSKMRYALIPLDMLP